MIAVIGAVFGEWSGADEGLGHLILVAQGQLQTARVFAAVVVLSALAIALFGLLALLERRLAWWRPRRRRRDLRTSTKETGLKPRIALASVARSPARPSPPAAARSRRTPTAATPSRSPSRSTSTSTPTTPGIFTALERGYFDEAGLEVEPQVPVRPLGADPPGGRRARRPRDLLRARGRCWPATRACR